MQNNVAMVNVRITYLRLCICSYSFTCSTPEVLVVFEICVALDQGNDNGQNWHPQESDKYQYELREGKRR